MIIKTFVAESSSAALKYVNEEMGGGAIVLKSRQLVGDDGKPAFEVTACLENPSDALSSRILSGRMSPGGQQAKRPAVDVGPEKSAENAKPVEGWKNELADIDRKLDRLLNLGVQARTDSSSGVFQDIYHRLKEADVPNDYIDCFVASLIEGHRGSDDFFHYVRGRLVEDISAMMVPDLSFAPGDKLTFIGPAGSGKSSVLGKLAAWLVVKEKKKVRLVTLDDVKISAYDELRRYADILRVDIDDPRASRHEAENTDDSITLIDSPALPTDGDRSNRLIERIQAMGPQYRFAVFSSLTRSKDIAVWCQRITGFEPTHHVMTMLDLTDCYGSALAAVRCTGKKIAFVTDSPGGIGALKAPDPDLMARKLLGVEVTLG